MTRAPIAALLATLVTAGAGLLSSSCSTEAFCFECEGAATGGTSGAGGADGSGGTGAQFGFDAGGDSGMEDAGGDGGCDADLQTDPNNCGACGNACNLPGAFPRCENGQCIIDTCADGLVDVDGDDTNGCECTISNGGNEACDTLDNDCNGQVDEGFDLQTDIDNCGACNNPCPDLPNSTKSCVAGMCEYDCDPGFASVDQAGGFSGCSYACPVFPTTAEACNGIDDDCDGVIDNGMPGAGVPCEDNCPNGMCQGECQPGTTVCTGTGSGIVCTGGVGPTGEVCDTLDNDCDGQADEDFDLQTDELNCGGCGIQCQAGDDCIGGKCQFTCADGFKDIDGNPSNGCEYACPVFPEQPETCNGVDDDCNGITDDNPNDVGGNCTGDCPSPDPCVAQGNCSPYPIAPDDGTCYGVCSTGGVETCVGGLKVCKHAGQRVDELCNTLDDNCDGRVDEGFDTTSDPNNCGSCGNACTANNALAVSCTASVCDMVLACDPGFADLNGQVGDGCEYTCPVNPPVGESCNGVDDDCDGVVDNVLSGLGQACTSDCPTPDPCVTQGNCPFPVSGSSNNCFGVCANDGRTACTSGSTVCNHPQQRSEICNNRDDDCNGMVDDGFDKQNDPNHCGGCGNVCSLPGTQSHSCTNGVCGVSQCANGFANIDGNPANGCEYQCPTFPTQAETCNGIDDDCNGLVDDNPSGVGVACQDNCPGGVCQGECQPGTTSCVSGTLVCQGGGNAQLEICDGKDNNCNGQTDEGFDLQNDPNNCGTCGFQCNLTRAIEGCSGGSCTIVACEDGFGNNDGNVNNGCEYTCPQFPTSTEVCDGVDNDCDGDVDSADGDLTAPANNCIQVGPCSGSGLVCQGSQGWRCNYPSGVETNPDGTVVVVETRCDDFDNNCNGQVDETFANKGLPCSVGVGICAGNSTWDCRSDETGLECPVSDNPTAAVDELCNGLDDNCDGQVDERNPVAGSQCYNGGQHACLGWTDPMRNIGGGTWVYQYEASRPDATSSDAGVEEARACSAASVLPWTSVTRAEAAAACASIEDSAGQPMRLCTESEWETACRAGNGGTVWSYASNQSTYQAGVCNDANASQGGPWPTANNNSCRANWSGSTDIWDMSGNVSEWTSTAVTVNGTTYNRVRGGNYQTLAGGTTCGFSFVLQTQSFANFDLGFRCCADNAP